VNLEPARGRTIPDVLGPGLRVLFCGINPSLQSGLTGHHYARPGNRFWAALHRSGFTDRQLRPAEDATLLQYGLGCTTARADEVPAEELRAGAVRLRELAGGWRPQWVAIVGIGAARLALRLPPTSVGRQECGLGSASLWVLPSTSGLNAHHQLADLADAFAALRQAVLRG
jgi:TDG/mug DNA glycosylase family protein